MFRLLDYVGEGRIRFARLLPAGRRKFMARVARLLAVFGRGVIEVPVIGARPASRRAAARAARPPRLLRAPLWFGRRVGGSRRSLLAWEHEAQRGEHDECAQAT
jgi:hypothetical protein